MMTTEQYPCLEWMRLTEAANRIGIQRARMYELPGESNGEIKSCTLKSPGAKRGARLVNMASVFAYLNNVADKQLAAT